jgi:5'-nucleotidase
MKENKEVLLIDMDGVIVDFEQNVENYYQKNPKERKRFEGEPDMIPGIFRNPPPIKDSIKSVKLLINSGKYDVVICTTAPWGNPQAASDKRFWIEQYFGDSLKKQMVITHRKDLVCGDYLIDDRLANGSENFKGELIHFGWSYENQNWSEYPTWESVLKRLL